MKQAVYGLILYLFLMAPPVIHLSESIMAIHMHVQMPLLAVVGMLMTPLLQKSCLPFSVSGMKMGFLVCCYLLLYLVLAYS